MDFSVRLYLFYGDLVCALKSRRLYNDDGGHERNVKVIELERRGVRGAKFSLWGSRVCLSVYLSIFLSSYECLSLMCEPRGASLSLSLSFVLWYRSSSRKGTFLSASFSSTLFYFFTMDLNSFFSFSCVFRYMYGWGGRSWLCRSLYNQRW